jgi:hypothetical protein
MEYANKLPEKVLNVAMDLIKNLDNNNLELLVKYHQKNKLNGAKEFFFQKSLNEIAETDPN